MLEKLKDIPYHASCPAAMINTQYLKHLFMVPKVFESLKFDCICDTELFCTVRKCTLLKNLDVELPESLEFQFVLIELF